MIDTIRNFLLSLGNTSQEIYNYLKENNCKGTPRQAMSCVIANLVKKKFNFSEVRVLTDGVVILPSGAATFGVGTIGKFITEFDDYQYPDLIEYN